MLRDNITQEVRKMDLSGLFFAIGHAPATKFLKGQLELDEYGYIVTKPDSTATSVPGGEQGVCVCMESTQRRTCSCGFA
jgi:thioredoxin reductase (NADPH)